MKKLLVLTSVILLFAVFSFAQVWVYDSDFVSGRIVHGITIDPEGKIWISFFAPTDTLDNGKTASGLYVYNADGSPASFSPVTHGEINGVPDTLRYNSRGTSTDNNGNILHCSGFVYRINYQTGEFMNRYDYLDAVSSLTEAAADDNGFIYVTHVLSARPIQILNEDFEYYNNVVDSTKSIQRSLLVSPDGNDVYIGTIYAGVNGVRHYQSVDGSGPDGEYALVDTFGTVFKEGVTPKEAAHNMWGQCLDWDRNGLMWVGTYWDVGVSDFSGWYALDPTQNWGIVDTVGRGVPFVLGVRPEGGTYNAPRNAAWSLDGKTMYTGDFDGQVVKKWTNENPKGTGSPIIGLEELVVSLRGSDGRPVVLVNFDLKQNYPNPFNPKTRIPFDINEQVHVKLVVYDVNGRLVQTLVDQQLMPKRYEYEFDGSNLASGTYFYQLHVNGVFVTKQMLLIK